MLLNRPEWVVHFYLLLLFTSSPTQKNSILVGFLCIQFYSCSHFIHRSYFIPWLLPLLVLLSAFLLYYVYCFLSIVHTLFSLFYRQSHFWSEGFIIRIAFEKERCWMCSDRGYFHDIIIQSYVTVTITRHFAYRRLVKCMWSFWTYVHENRSALASLKHFSKWKTNVNVVILSYR